MKLTGCDYKSMEREFLLLQIFQETLSEGCFDAKADGMAAVTTSRQLLKRGWVVILNKRL